MAVDLTPRQPAKAYGGEGGAYYEWSPAELPMLGVASIGAAKLALAAGGMSLPSYFESAKVAYVLQRVPKTNGEIPSFDEAFSDHRRLLDKLVLYGLVELTVNGDDNCQFWALSDQFYRTPEHRRFVRQQVVNQGFGGDADGRREVHGLGGVVDADVRRGEAAACHLPLAPQHTGCGARVRWLPPSAGGVARGRHRPGPA
ncbi:uncharacterized protein [Aegilops tauschii subsp. strangulata]|uniref:Cupin type-1 domain-containing protein n=1 Tax=Aegilops tauschii subsp. strangulata TaxID=200361 RepID=A0A453PRS8_AEGTS|nr:uncharacterized protein LOC109751343 isoform X3 [Aegilops tauschii subsp. strangulata]XP_044421155.1 uncharacterized protein LOC123145737 isoform X2 [Triticum aestivum]